MYNMYEETQCHCEPHYEPAHHHGHHDHDCMHREIEKIEKKLHDLSKEMAKSEIVDNNQSNAILDNSHAIFENTKLDAKRDEKIASNETKLANLSEIISSNTECISSLDERVAALEEKEDIQTLDELIERVDTLETNVEALTSGSTEQSGELHDLYESLRLEIKDRRDSVNAVEEKLFHILNKMEKMQKEIDELKEKHQ